MLEGYRTYAGIIIAILGGLGLGNYFNDNELSEFVNAILVVVGGLVSLYFNWKNHIKIENLK